MYRTSKHETELAIKRKAALHAKSLHARMGVLVLALEGARGLWTPEAKYFAEVVMLRLHGPEIVKRTPVVTSEVIRTMDDSSLAVSSTGSVTWSGNRRIKKFEDVTRRAVVTVAVYMRAPNNEEPVMVGQRRIRVGELVSGSGAESRTDQWLQLSVKGSASHWSVKASSSAKAASDGASVRIKGWFRPHQDALPPRSFSTMAAEAVYTSAVTTNEGDAHTSPVLNGAVVIGVRHYFYLCLNNRAQLRSGAQPLTHSPPSWCQMLAPWSFIIRNSNLAHQQIHRPNIQADMLLDSHAGVGEPGRAGPCRARPHCRRSRRRV